MSIGSASAWHFSETFERTHLLPGRTAEISSVLYFWAKSPFPRAPLLPASSFISPYAVVSSFSSARLPLFHVRFFPTCDNETFSSIVLHFRVFAGEGPGTVLSKPTAPERCQHFNSSVKHLTFFNSPTYLLRRFL